MRALLGGTEMSRELAAPVRPLRDALSGRIEAIIGARAPELPAADRARLAQVSLQVFKAMLPLTTGTAGAERKAMVAELKKVLRGYLAPVIGG